MDKKKILLIFITLAFARVLSSIFQPIADCDETYNYWEPLHLLMYGHGLQTWEYSPLYGLRSYFFVLLHSPIGFLSKFLFFRKPVIFYSVRCSIGIMSALGETFFVVSILKRFPGISGVLTWIFLLFSPGMFNLAQNFLPGTFSMIFLLFTFGVWLRLDKLANEEGTRRKYVWLGTFCACVAIVIGWPFVVVCVFLIVFECFIREKFFWLLKTCIIITLIVLGPMILIDSFLYRKIMFATYNLVMYNKGSGSEKYGVENWHFYGRNLITAFNLVFVASIVAPFCVFVCNFINKKDEGWVMKIYYTVPYFIWLGFYSWIPHKEERFMAPVYPLVCFTAAIGISSICKTLFTLFEKKELKELKEKEKVSYKSSILTMVVVAGFIFIYIVLSVSRIYSIVKLFGAPLNLYGKLYWKLDSYDSSSHVKVCVGKEWYRYSSSFFLPFENIRLGFVRSHFDGLLPKYFKDDFESLRDTISHIPEGMNDQNIEEMDRYVNPEECHYLIDFDFKGQTEERFYKNEELWEILMEEKFLDIGESKSALARAFYIPFYSDKKNVYGRYFVLKNKKLD